MTLVDHVAVVTGAAQGIGLACATAFAREGAKVVLSDVNQATLNEAVATLEKTGAQVLAVPCDVSNKAEVDALIAATVARFGRIDLMLSNAGITHAAEFLDVDEADFDRVLGVNLKGVFLTGQAAARQMVKQAPLANRANGERGIILNMSSVNAVIAIPNQIPYVTSKGGVNQLTKAMAMSLAPHGIRVNAIGPGTIATELAVKAVMSNEEGRRKIMSRTPLRRLGEPAEIARVAVFLAGEGGSYFTGQTLYPDGGRLALNYTVAVE